MIIKNNYELKILLSRFGNVTVISMYIINFIKNAFKK
jgi:hypothetical protein